MATAATQAQTGAGASGAGAGSSGSTQGTTSSQGGVDAGTPGGTGTENSSMVDRSSFPPPRRDQSPPQGLRSDTNNNPTGLTQLTNQPGSTAQPSVDTGGRSSGVASQGQTTQSITNRYGQLGGGVLGGGTLPGQLNNGFQTNNGGLTPTSDRGATPNFYSTNRSQGVTNTTYSTNTTTVTRTLRQDIAVTMEDRVVLTQIRRQTAPVLTQITTTRPVGSTSPWMPVHFAVQQGVVTLVGTVPTVQESERVVTMVQQVPGVVRVINQLRSVDERTTVAGSSGWNAGETSPTNRETWQSGSDVVASTNTTDSGIVASTNNTSGSGIVSATNTWDPTLLPTSDRINGGSRIYGTNQSNGQTNRWTASTNRAGLPPGLQNREQLPPGLQNRDTLPPGLQRGQNSSRTNR